MHTRHSLLLRCAFFLSSLSFLTGCFPVNSETIIRQQDAFRGEVLSFYLFDNTQLAPNELNSGLRYLASKKDIILELYINRIGHTNITIPQGTEVEFLFGEQIVKLATPQMTPPRFEKTERTLYTGWTLVFQLTDAQRQQLRQGALNAFRIRFANMEHQVVFPYDRPALFQRNIESIEKLRNNLP